MKKNNVKKVIVVLLAAVMLVGCSIGATLAWLADKTESITNTFTSSDINITLKETKQEGGTELANSYKMVPGGTITKDPVVTVVAGSEACWLFVKLDKSDNYDTYLEEYSLDAFVGWQSVPENAGVYYIEVSADAAKAGKTYQVLTDNSLTVKTSVTKANMEAIKSSDQPTLTITAYAVQQLGFSTPKAAWDEAKKLG